jgi:hypothetical protein
MDSFTDVGGRYALFKSDDNKWTVKVDGFGQIEVSDEYLANRIFQLSLKSHNIGYNMAFAELRYLIGAAHG